MKKTFIFMFVCIISSAGFWRPAAAKSDWEKTLSQYSCMEVERFQVNREDYSSVSLERAALIPDETLASLQHKIVGEIFRKKIVENVVKADEKVCSGKALIYGGMVTDYKKGSRTARILVGLGAGKQKLEVDSFVRDKETNKILARKTVTDRKFGGIAGGDEAKGERDFAEKVAEFLTEGE